MICYSAYLSIDVHCSTHLKKKKFLIQLPIKIIKTHFIFFIILFSHRGLLVLSSSHLPTLISLQLSVSTVPAHTVAVTPYHHSSFVQPHEMPVLLHRPLVHVLASGERHRRAPQEHEPTKRRRTGEENPLPDIRIASMSQPILGVAVKSETASETERRSDEFQGIDGREPRN